ncbi:MAG: sensor domain-containing protein [Janthinobacterium lividum]
MASLSVTAWLNTPYRARMSTSLGESGAAMKHGDEKLPAVTTRAGLQAGEDGRRFVPGQGEHTEHQLRTLVEGVPHLIWRSCNLGLWTWASPQWLAYTGQSQEDTHGHGWLGAVHPHDHERTLAAWEAALPHGELEVEFRLHRASDSAWVWHRTASLPLRDESGRIIEWIGSTTNIQDYKDLQARQETLLATVERHACNLEEEIAQRRQVEARLAYAASHDLLTDLHNRAWFMERLQQVLAGAGAMASGCSVLFLDLDDFASVNDTLGHHAGDQLLVALSRRMRACLGPQSALARLGGDEFAVLVEGADNMDAATWLAQRFAEAMRDPVLLGVQEVFSACSIGVAHSAAGACTPQELMRDADIAMYWVKREDRGGYALFTQGMRNEAAGELDLQTDLRRAVDRGEFVVHYQPICDAATGHLVALEALVRWQHPERGLVPPALFIPASERTGLIRDIGRWVLREACAQASAWHARFPGLELWLSVNASGEELRDRRYLSEVQHVLAETGLAPRLLQIEVTEGVFLRHPEVAGEVLGALRGLGIRIALDDFGTGYSSLGYLNRYPVDALKIDRSFVAEMLAQPRTWAVVEAIVKLGQAMDLSVVAEGVEENAQLQALHAAGCDLMQGYLFAVPLPAKQIEELLRSPHRLLRTAR